MAMQNTIGTYPDPETYTPWSQSNRSLMGPPTVADSVFELGHEFDFFQAVSILESIYGDCQSVGSIGRKQPAVRFAARSSSHSFAASSIYEILPATAHHPVAKMTVGFMGLTGPAGILPQHYTEVLRRIELEAKGPQKFALRDWLDLFNDRMIALFYRSWKKYRPYAYHAQALKGHEDRFTNVLQSLAGLGLPSLAHQVRRFAPSLSAPASPESPTVQQNTRAGQNPPSSDQTQTTHAQTTPKPTAPVKQSRGELALLRYSGLLSQRPRSASNLKQLLEDYFELPVEVKQFHGNWLTLDESAQTRLGVKNGNSILGQNAVVGDQTWERQNKILIVVGPLNEAQFTQLMPDHESDCDENDFSLLTKLVRLFVGPEMEFDIQMKLQAHELPEPKLAAHNQQGMRLGWNSWLAGGSDNDVVADTLFCVDV